MSPKFSVFFGSLWVALLTTTAAARPEPLGPLPTRLDLATVTALAVEHNPSVALAREQAEESTGAVVEVRARKLPRVDLVSDFTLTDPNRTQSFGFGESVSESWSVRVDAAWEVFASGSVKRSIAARELTRQATLEGLRATLDAIILATREAWFRTLFARDVIGVREANEALLREQLALARNRLQSGVGSQFEVLRAEVALANARPPLIRARNEYLLALEALRQQTGLAYPAGIDPVALEVVGDWDMTPMPQPVEAVLDKALATRAELSQAELRTQSAEEEVRVARAGDDPKFELFAGYGAFSDTDSSDPADALAGFVGGARLSWPLWDAGATRGRVLQARSRLRQTELNTVGLILQIEGEVRSAYLDLRNAEAIVANADLVIRQAEEALRLANNRLSAGAATQLDVLQAQLELTNARLEKAQASYDYSVARARLLRAQGDVAVRAE